MHLFNRLGSVIFRQIILQAELKISCKVCVPTFVTKKFYCDSPSALRSKKAKSSRGDTVQYFVDYYRVRTTGGNGGNGCISFLSAWANEFGGPDGGDGGNGGHVIFRATSTTKGLNAIKAVVEAPHGEKGDTRNCTGKNAVNKVIDVPIGTIVKDTDGTVVADLSEQNMMFIAARGGAGGKGNKYFTTDTQQSPEVAEKGALGEQNVYFLEMRSMADIGLLGFPNAGKSTLLRALTRARPRVAPYPFTTLKPNLGTVMYDDHEQLTIADLPGLIEGSHKNKGLGIQFLQHAERCAGLLYMVDSSIDEPWKQIKQLQFELSKFNPEMLNRPYLIIANKMDLEDAVDNIKQLEKHFAGTQVLAVSAKFGNNLSKLLKAIRLIYDNSEARRIKERQEINRWN